jgi:hypothetical protein
MNAGARTFNSRESKRTRDCAAGARAHREGERVLDNDRGYVERALRSVELAGAAASSLLAERPFLELAAARLGADRFAAMIEGARLMAQLRSLYLAKAAPLFACAGRGTLEPQRKGRAKEPERPAGWYPGCDRWIDPRARARLLDRIRS